MSCNPHMWEWHDFVLHPNGYVSHTVRCETCDKIKHRPLAGDLPNAQARLRLTMAKLRLSFERLSRQMESVVSRIGQMVSPLRSYAREATLPPSNSPRE